MDRGFFSTDYAIDGQEVDCDAFEQELAKVPEAISKWKTGNILRYTSWGVAAGGGFLVGYVRHDTDQHVAFFIGHDRHFHIAVVLSEINTLIKDRVVLLHFQEGQRIKDPYHLFSHDIRRKTQIHDFHIFADQHMICAGGTSGMLIVPPNSINLSMPVIPRTFSNSR